MYISSDSYVWKDAEYLTVYELIENAKVICGNYSSLWQHLDPSKLLPKLVDNSLMTEAAKNEAKSYGHKFAQNSFIIDQLVRVSCPTLIKQLCDALDVTGQKDLAIKLMQGTV